MPTSQWPAVLPDALYALRLLLCTATNATPHERIFCFSRRSIMGTSLTTWLSHPGPALLKKHVRYCKMDPLVEEVELLETNPQYAYVRFPDGGQPTAMLPKGAISPPPVGDFGLPGGDGRPRERWAAERAKQSLELLQFA
ncbi:hypothetical protein M513_08582 [Trichuris suis]|uniref:Uncharacterized protein n=1 Tax=Trichuris suis TaxID=68888 RepID=A0A085LZW8_9BILA|nr:hypothetical protein M513_08582 [Trichuris suis]